MNSVPPAVALAAVTLVSTCLAAPPEHQLLVNDARLIRQGEPVARQAVAGIFGPGLDCVTLVGGRPARSQVRFPCAKVPAGDYFVGLLLQGEGYLTFGEFLPSSVHLYHNDRRVVFGHHTEPCLPEQAVEKRRYQAELQADEPLRLHPDDTLSVVFDSDGGHVNIGPVRLYRAAPTPGPVAIGAPDWGRPRSHWLTAHWLPAQRQGNLVQQGCRLTNPGARARTFDLVAEARDYHRRDLLTRRERLTLAPGESVQRTWSITLTDSPRASLAVVASAAGVFPPVRLARYWADEPTSGPRPGLCLNGDWSWCPVPGAECGQAPPADAKWQRIRVPSLQSNDHTHGAWYRRTFEAPAHLTGERIVLRCGQALSEATVYLNGRKLGTERWGSQPFELEVTAGFRPGQRNELLIALRDWLAYSPRNRDRIARGEAPIFKDGLTDVAGYPGASRIGLGGNVVLEARPALAIEDVFVVTSVRERKLTLRYRVRNAGAAERTGTLTPRVLEAGQPVLSLPATPVRVPAGGTATVTVSAPWPTARLWSPEDPHLYVLQTDLAPDSGAADRHLERFGFRELWIDGIHFVLNGTRRKIRSAWAGGAHGHHAAEGVVAPADRLAAIWSWQTHSVHDRDVQLSRTHNLGGVEECAEVADETGLLLKIEDESVAQTNFTFDQTFWKNVVAHELRVVDIYKNHASVVMWSAGNENMWGWIYQGEAAKTMGNRHQVKVAKAMREADLMRRPIEWEADGDLMGAWEHHALHYPAELSGRPDVPVSAWWGRLDGRTVVPYSMGNITLGAKPLTVGEAFWPANLAHPYGETIVLGDDAYLGGNYWIRGWQTASRYFINGFRDAEFALIDIYLPLWEVPAQAVVPKQETASFHGGRTLHRELNVHHDLARPAQLSLRWRLAAAGGAAPVAQGEHQLALAPAELKRLAVDVPLPATKEPTPLRFEVTLTEAGRTVHQLTRDWQVHPAPAIRAPAGLQLSVYDPAGATAALLRRWQVPFTAAPQLLPPATGALLIGRDALSQAPEGAWREALGAFVRAGGKVAILEQREAPDFLPVALTMATGRRATLAFARAGDHPLLAGLTDADLRWWADDHLVSVGAYRKPLRGNVLPLVDTGTPDGIVETPLLEEYDGRGSFVLCQLRLTEAAGTAPAAGRLWQNLLSYLAAPTGYRTPGASALLARPDSPLRAMLDDSRLVCDDLTGQLDQLDPARYRLALADAAVAAEPGTARALRAFAAAGGRVLINRPGPEQQAALESLLGLKLRFLPVKEQPNDIQYHVFRRTNQGLMAGISNHELFWATHRLLPDLRHEGGWWSGYHTPPEEWIADWFCLPADEHAERAVRLTRPGGLLSVPLGRGAIVVNSLRWDQPHNDVQATVTRLRSLLLTNLGGTLKGDGTVAADQRRRRRDYSYFTVDLAPYANRGLTSNAATGLVGWTNQGENDMRGLPAGTREFAGIPFQIGSPKGAVVLYSTQANNTGLPKQVTGIRIGRRADVLFFLHTIAWSADRPFAYRVHYEDGSTVDLTIVNGQQVIDWWSDPTRYAEAMARHGLFVAWRGDNPMRKGVILPGWEWANPHPDKVIRDVDFLTVPESRYSAVPVLVAITGAVNRPLTGTVTDVIGTRGVKVRLGTQEQEVYYLGVAGIDVQHPYALKAVAAHRAMAVGQTVSLQLDQVAQDPAGHLLAWVFLGRDHSQINNLLNGRVVGEGLAKLGSFHGNARHRMFLENLGFIAQQRRAGLWAEGK